MTIDQKGEKPVKKVSKNAEKNSVVHITQEAGGAGVAAVRLGAQVGRCR